MTDPAHTERRRSLHGHVSADDPLSPHRAFASLSWPARQLVGYQARDWWDQDTLSLPRPLQRYRRRVRAFADRELFPRALRVDGVPHRAPGEIDPDSWAALCAAGREGLLSDLLPRPLGSASPLMLSAPLALAQAIKTEELACADGGLMLLICAHALGAAPLLLSGSLPLFRRVLLPAFRACERGEPHLFAFAITEPQAGSDVEDGHGANGYRPGVRAQKVPGGFLLQGRKVFISGGDVAKHVVVFASLADEGMASWTAFVVPHDAAGFRAVRTELKLGMRASSAAELELDAVFVPDAARVGALRGGWALNRATLNLSRIPVAGMGVGFARAATELALDFACRFQLGGRRLIDFQDVQLELADMLAETQAARTLVWSAGSRRAPLQREASAAKFYCTDVAFRVCSKAMDLLGNHAVLHSERVEKALRDARLTQIFEGTNEINRLSLIEDIQESLLARMCEKTW